MTVELLKNRAQTGEHILLVIDINGSDVGALLDTGSTHTYIDKSFAETVRTTNFEHRPEYQSNLAGIISDEGFVAVEVNVDDIGVSSLFVKTFDFSKFPYKGIIGTDIIRNGKLKLDMENQTLELTP